MRFSNVIALVAILTTAGQAYSADGTLRRVAQDEAVAANEPTVVLIPANQSISVQQAQPAAPAAQAQPATVVEAAPVTESKAEMLRKARQNQEVQTEQRIVEKLEESRLREEQQRADRLFGDKLDAPVTQPAAAVVPAPVAVPVAQPAVQSAPIPAPAPVPAQNVTIEKIEIVQPQAEEKKDEPAGETAAAIEEEKPAPFTRKFYVGGVLAAPSYSAANLKTNYGLGFTVGTQVDPNWAIEGMFLFSNHYVDTFWDYNLYREMDQYDFQVAAKYYFLTGKIKPYVGASAAYVTREYKDRIKNSAAYTYNQNNNSEETQSGVAGILAGADFSVSDQIMIGAGIDYNHPVMNRNTPNFVSYGLPENTKPVEEFDYYTFKVTAKLLF